jgi:hypothetical protein
MAEPTDGLPRLAFPPEHHLRSLVEHRSLALAPRRQTRLPIHKLAEGWTRAAVLRVFQAFPGVGR